MTISKFEDPRMFAISTTTYIFEQTLMYMWTDALIVEVQQRERVFFACLFLRNLQLQHIVLPHQTGGNLKLPTCFEGGFLDRLQCC